MARVPKRATLGGVVGTLPRLEGAERAVTSRFASRLAATEQQTLDTLAAPERWTAMESIDLDIARVV